MPIQVFDFNDARVGDCYFLKNVATQKFLILSTHNYLTASGVEFATDALWEVYEVNSDSIGLKYKKTGKAIYSNDWKLNCTDSETRIVFYKQLKGNNKISSNDRPNEWIRVIHDYNRLEVHSARTTDDAWAHFEIYKLGEQEKAKDFILTEVKSTNRIGKNEYLILQSQLEGKCITTWEKHCSGQAFTDIEKVDSNNLLYLKESFVQKFIQEILEKIISKNDNEFINKTLGAVVAYSYDFEKQDMENLAYDIGDTMNVDAKSYTNELELFNEVLDASIQAVEEKYSTEANIPSNVFAETRAYLKDSNGYDLYNKLKDIQLSKIMSQIDLNNTVEILAKKISELNIDSIVWPNDIVHPTEDHITEVIEILKDSEKIVDEMNIRDKIREVIDELLNISLLDLLEFLIAHEGNIPNKIMEEFEKINKINGIVDESEIKLYSITVIIAICSVCSILTALVGCFTGYVAICINYQKKHLEELTIEDLINGLFASKMSAPGYGLFYGLWWNNVIGVAGKYWAHCGYNEDNNVWWGSDLFTNTYFLRNFEIPNSLSQLIRRGLSFDPIIKAKWHIYTTGDKKDTRGDGTGDNVNDRYKYYRVQIRRTLN